MSAHAVVRAVAFLLVGLSAHAKDLRKEVVVAAPIADVWAAWSTNAGAQTFFAPGSNIELRMGGAYDWVLGNLKTRFEKGPVDWAQMKKQ